MISSRTNPRIQTNCSSNSGSVSKSHAIGHHPLTSPYVGPNRPGEGDGAVPYTGLRSDRSGVAKKKSTPKTVRALRIGVVDTMFARFDMGASARAELERCSGYGETFTVLSRTVPGFKDLAVAAMNLIEEDGCAIVVALGMPGSAPIDKQCAHEASQGIMLAQLMTATPILEVFVHEDESDDPEVLAKVFDDRSRKHARNAYWMLFEPEQLRARAGQGIRQGFEDAGPLDDA